MSTAPPPFDDSGGTAAAAHPGGTAANAPGSPRTRPSSSLAARLLTALYALVVTPIATGLIAFGGVAWLRVYLARYHDDSVMDLLAGSLGVKLALGLGLGILLLASVAATGIASSAGLLVVGVLGLVSLALSAFPALASMFFRTLSEFLPYEVLDGLIYGLPLVLHLVMGGLGVGLFLTRRRPDPQLALSLLGLLVIPIALLLGAAMLFYGLGRGLVMASQTMETQIPMAAMATLVLGALLLVLAAAASRWSPYALLVPALVLIVATLLFTAPLSLPFLPAAWAAPTTSTAASFLFIGGGISTAVVLLVHTAVQTRVRSRARRRLRVPVMPVPAGAGPAGSSADGG